ncbi:MAG: 6-phosphogluconolactonase, partial [Myxococcaceae bacterium]|nr:6-phosphogluconolactonase [Myxococcaceae bacterium]
VSESAATLSVYRVANHQLVAPALQTLTTVPAEVTHFDRARAAEVAVDGHGLVYVSTRFDALQTDGTYLPLEGYVTSYRPRGPDGSLSPVQATRVGKEPRHFSIDPTSRFLVVANQESNSVVSYRIEGASGGLRRASSVDIPHPEYAGAVLLP